MEPRVLFLGFCDRAQFNPNTGRWTAIGLSHYVATPLLPLRLQGSWICLAIKFHAEDLDVDLKILNDAGAQVGNFRIQASSSPPIDGAEPESGQTSFHPHTWSPVFLRAQGDGIFITSPGRYLVVTESAAGTTEVGSFDIIAVTAPEFTPERVAAIRSDPHAIKSVRAVVGCKHCASKYKIYFGLDKSDETEREGWRWSKDIDPYFECECGQSKIDLSYIKDGIGAYIGRTTIEDAAPLDIRALPLYERSSLQTIRDQFFSLISSTTSEEDIQKFINNNPILLHRFSAVKLISKPSIGTKYRADFAILDSHSDLILIEIESAAMKLLRKNGHRSSKLIHAFDQVGDWLNEISEHRISILDGMGLKYDEVNKIRCAVIAGRDAGHDAAHLRNLHKRPNDGFEFLTYDDIVAGMDALILRMETI